MTTHVTFRPHYCDKRYGETVSDRIYHMKLFGIPRSLPIISTALVGKLNSFFLPGDTQYLCNGGFELYPVYYKKPDARTVTMVKELTFWGFDKLPEYKKSFLRKMFSTNTGIITDTEAMKSLITKQVNTEVEVVNPFCAQPFLENKPKLDTKNIIFIGSFESPTKGYSKLIEAFRLLGSGWRLSMVGKRGTDFVKTPGAGIEITNFVPSLKPYLSKCSMCVHPADFEPFGVSVLESMSAGLIPIVTKATGISEVLVKNGLKNLIIGNNDPALIKDKIEEVHNYSMAKKKNISGRCKKIVRNGYLEKDGLEEFRKKFEILVSG